MQAVDVPLDPELLRRLSCVETLRPDHDTNTFAPQWARPPLSVARRAAGFMEHRWGQRRNTFIDVRILPAGPRAARYGRLLEVSSSGALIQTDLPLPPLTRVTLEISPEALRTGTALLRLPGCVVRNIKGAIAVEWCEPIREVSALLTDRSFQSCRPFAAFSSP